METMKNTNPLIAALDWRPPERKQKIMSVYYKVYQNNNKSNPNKGKWYARAAMVDTDSTDDLAKNIMEKCTVNEADVLAVIKALISEMTRSLQASHRVKLPGLGTFKLGISTRPADSRKEFTSANVKDVHVLFSPELKFTRGGSKTRSLITGTHVKELEEYNGTSAADAGTKDASKDNTKDSTKENTGGSDAGAGSGDAGDSGDAA